MNIKMLKRISSSLVALTLVLGASAANANSISIVNHVAGDTTPADINVFTDLGANGLGLNTFSMDLIATTAESVANAITQISWSSGVLNLDSYTIAGGMLDLTFGGANITPSSSVTLKSGQFLGGVFNNTVLATLNFSYVGPGSTNIMLNPIAASADGLIEGWNSFGTAIPVSFTNLGDSITNATVSAVPLPPAFLLLGSALVGLGFTGRRKAIAA